MTTDEVDVMGIGRCVERLYQNDDFQKAILEGFIDNQALVLGKSFEGSDSQLDALKAITYLTRYLEQSIEDSKILIQQNKG